MLVVRPVSVVKDSAQRVQVARCRIEPRVNVLRLIGTMQRSSPAAATSGEGLVGSGGE
jgi:hypothetical protein